MFRLFSQSNAKRSFSVQAYDKYIQYQAILMVNEIFYLLLIYELHLSVHQYPKRIKRLISK